MTKGLSSVQEQNLTFIRSYTRQNVPLYRTFLNASINQSMWLQFVFDGSLSLCVSLCVCEIGGVVYLHVCLCDCVSLCAPSEVKELRN